MCRLIRLAIAAVVTGVLVWLPDVARPVSRSPVPTDPRGRHHAASGHGSAAVRRRDRDVHA